MYSPDSPVPLERMKQLCRECGLEGVAVLAVSKEQQQIFFGTHTDEILELIRERGKLVESGQSEVKPEDVARGVFLDLLRHIHHSLEDIGNEIGQVERTKDDPNSDYGINRN